MSSDQGTVCMPRLFCVLAAEQYLGDTKALLLRANLLKCDFAQKAGGPGRQGGGGRGGGGGGGHHAPAAFFGALGSLGGFVDAGQEAL